MKTDTEVKQVDWLRRSERKRKRTVPFNQTPAKKPKTTKQKHSKNAAVMPVVDLPAAVMPVVDLPAAVMPVVDLPAAVVPVVDAGFFPEKSAYLKVKETLREFNNYYLHCIQEEDKRCEKAAEMRERSREPIKKTSKRPDLKASTKMRLAKKFLYSEKQIGHIPGVDVGYQFFSRAEMVVVGFHSELLSGIDIISKGNCKGKYKNYKLPIAVAIVMSGQYEDDDDNSEKITYTGQGGNDLLGNKKQKRDQELIRGNLALQNSMLQNLPVRVIRGHPSKTSYVGKIYTYDGLYKVVECWENIGRSGFIVYRFSLERLGEQPKLTTNQVQFIRGGAKKTIDDLPGLVCKDISRGQERKPIPVTNEVDESPPPTEGFEYRTTIKVSDNVKIPAPEIGCGCVGRCVDPNICACAKRNGSEFPYVKKDGCRLVEAKDVVFECGPKCGCGPDCINRTSQQKSRFQFEIFRTKKKGWGVRSWDYIPAGSPICEYIGVLKRSDEANNVLDNMFIFDIDCLQTMNGLEGRERRFKDVSIPNEVLSEKVDSTAEFCIDALSTGNFARFINHSCEPNLFIQCILSSHHDLNLARVVLFAADNIPPLQELSYDYGYALDSVIGPDGKIKQMDCYCGAACCRKRLF